MKGGEDMKRIHERLNLYFFDSKKAHWTDQVLFYGTMTGAVVMTAAVKIIL